MGKGKLVLIGLDGADWEIIDALIAEGYLPNFKRMKESGSHAPLASTSPPLSPPAWTSIFTGVNPGKHGIFHFSKIIGGDKPVTTADVKCPFFWELLTDHRVLVFNAPFTYPPRPSVNCAWVSGFNTPSSDSPFTYPASLREEILRICPDYDIHYGNDVVKRQLGAGAGLMPKAPEAQLLSEVLSSYGTREAVALSLMESKPWDVAVIAFSEPDWLQHDLMAAFTDAKVKSETGIAKLYDRIDVFLGRLLDAGHNVVVVSDHGFLKVNDILFLNVFLRNEGLLKMKPASDLWRIADGALKTLALSIFIVMPPALIDLLKKLGPIKGAGRSLIIQNADHTLNPHGSGAYMVGMSGGICVRERTVVPELIKKLEALKDGSGRKVLAYAKAREGLYSGPELPNAPHIQTIPAKGFFLSRALHSGLTRPVNPSRDKAGTHSPYGIFLAAGPDLLPADIGDATVNDIAPTLLSFMSYEVPPYMDGRPLPVFSPRGRASLSRRTRQALVLLRHGKKAGRC